jgi:DivIVA domain-containing protein
MGPDPSLTAELIQAQSFTAGFRGYDQNEVRTFLARVAAEVRTLRERNTNLESAWHSAEERAARPPVLDEDTLMSAVGEETAAILRTARAASADLKTKAAEEAEKTLADANARAGEIHEEAQSVLARQSKAAEEAAARIVEGARSEAAGVLERARIESDTIRAKAEQERALTVEGANSTRDRILEDLSRRRRVATVQIEQLRAGRERLIESYAVVRRTLEEAQQELGRADAEARAAADEVGRRLRREHDLRPDDGHDLETEAAIASAPVDTPTPTDVGTGPADSTTGGDQAGPATVALPAVDPGASERGSAASEHGTEEAGHGETASQPAGSQAGFPPAKAEASPGMRGQAGPPTATAGGSPPAGPTRVGARRRGPFGRGRGSNAVAATAEHPAAMASAMTDPDTAGSADEQASGAEAGPYLRLVPDEPPPAGSTVDQLFARIRAGRTGSGSAESPPGEAPALGEETSDTLEAANILETIATAATAELVTTAGGATEISGERSREPESSDTDREGRLSDGDEALLQKRESAIVDLEVTLTRKLKRALQDEQNDLLDRLRSLRGEPTASALLPEHDVQVTRYADAASPLLAKAASAGVAFAGDVLETKPASRGSASVGDVANEAARSIVDALRRRLEEVISAHAGEDQSVMVESVGAAYREWKSQRIERISGDALSAAFSRGTWQAIPEGASMRWIVEDVDGPCPDCDDDALAGVLPRGEVFPTGQHYPPAHSGCRCLLVPVVIP